MVDEIHRRPDGHSRLALLNGNRPTVETRCSRIEGKFRKTERVMKYMPSELFGYLRLQALYVPRTNLLRMQLKYKALKYIEQHDHSSLNHQQLADIVNVVVTRVMIGVEFDHDLDKLLTKRGFNAPGFLHRPPRQSILSVLTECFVSKRRYPSLRERMVQPRMCHAALDP
nr:MAG: hypothetical protein [Chemarfal virus 172]